MNVGLRRLVEGGTQRQIGESWAKWPMLPDLSGAMTRPPARDVAACQVYQRGGGAGGDSRVAAADRA